MRLAAALVASAVLAAGAGACDRGAPDRPHVMVGAGTSVEQQVLAAVTADALEGAGYSVTIRPDLGDTRGMRRAALAGDIDVYWDYTGAAWALGMSQQAPPADAQESFARVQRADEERGLVWLEPSDANATLALFVRGADLPRDRGLSWLAGELSGGERNLCADRDFIERRGGLDALAHAYAMDLHRVSSAAVSAPESLALRYAAGGRCFAALGTATSGVARDLGLLPVDDTLAVFPAFIVAPVVREGRLEQLPALADVLRGVAHAIDTDTLARLNAAVVDGAAPDRVAQQFWASR